METGLQKNESTMYNAIYFILLFSLTFSSLHAQNSSLKNKKHLNTRIEIGIDRGIQLSKNFPILKSGEQINLSVSKLYGHHFEIGIGVQYQNLKNEVFTPIYLSLIGKRKPKKGVYIESQLGYSYGKNDKYEHALNASFRGGNYFLTGIGYRFYINEKHSFLASFNYSIQQSQVQHYENEIINYTEDLMFDLVVFKLGILLK